MVSKNRLLKRRGNGGIEVVAGLIILGVVAVVFFKPERIRTPWQVPVSMSIRKSMVGIGNVVQVRNTSTQVLRGVVVTGRNAGTNSSATYRIGTLTPGQLVEVGWMEWNWRVDPGETVTVSADGFLSIVFSADQLGVRASRSCCISTAEVKRSS